ncbi:MAG TPA: class 1 fructose-bisphosphatase [Longimicrobiales bacterium]
MSQRIVTIERHIIDMERQHPEATGAFSTILYDLAFAAKMIAREVNMAGLVDILGGTDERNIHGEQVQKLDAWAHDVIFKALDHCGQLACMASEEADEFIPIPDKFRAGKYVLLYDPLDGSSNIDANVSIGTIFSIHRKITTGERGTEQDCLQRGRDQVAAGYVVYGSSTMLVYTTGYGVHGFTLDPSIGEFLLSHPDIRIPSPGKRIYSVNEGNYANWSGGQRAFVDHLKNVDGSNAKPFSSRYIGSLVADFHRTLLYGGIFMYPADRQNVNGKLRLLYEAAPLAFIAEQAGGRGSSGEQDIADVVPTSLHQRTPLYLGSKELVDRAEQFLKQDAMPAAGHVASAAAIARP